MEEFKLSDNIDGNKIFVVQLKDIVQRIDPYYYQNEFAELRNNLNKKGFIKIGNILKSWNRGDGPRDGFYTEEENGVYFLRVNNLKNNTIDLTDVKLINRHIHEKTLKRTQVKGGDLIFAISGTKDNLGTVSILPNNIKEANLNSALVRLDLNTDMILKEFFCVLFDLKFIRTQIEFIGKGAAQNNLNNEEIKSIRIPNLPIEKQNEIVEFINSQKLISQQKEIEAKALLDSIDDYLLGELGITLPKEDDEESDLLLATETTLNYGNSDGFELDKKNLLVKKGRLFLTGFNQIVGQRIDAFYNKEYFEKVEKAINNGLFPIIKLKECIYFIESGSRPSGGVSHYEEGVLSFGGEHVNNNCELEVKTKKFIPFDFHKNILKTKTELNDILIVKDGATTGKIAIIENEEYIAQNINEHVFMLKTNGNCSPFYVAYYLHSKAGQIQIQRGITGATVTGITKEIVKNIIIPLPLISKQVQISQKIQEMRKKASELQQEGTAIIEFAKQQVERLILDN